MVDALILMALGAAVGLVIGFVLGVESPPCACVTASERGGGRFTNRPYIEKWRKSE